MTSINYEDVYAVFLGYIKDNVFLSKKYAVAEAFMKEWLKKAASKPYTRRIFSSLTLSDSTESISFELKCPIDDDTDAFFVKDILALGMVVAWLTPEVRNKVNIAQFFGGKEQKFYSQAAHIEQLQALLDDARLEQRKLIRDRGYLFNPYLSEGS